MNIIPQDQIDHEPIRLNTTVPPYLLKLTNVVFGVFIVSSEHILHFFLVFLLLTLNK